MSHWTRVRSLARQKSKWTMGGCGALRWTYEGTSFLCVKFRMGSAGEPTICSHCYDVLNEYIYIYIYYPTKSVIMLDNKKSPVATKLEIYYCFHLYLAWYATIKTTEGHTIIIWWQGWPLGCKILHYVVEMDHVFVSGAVRGFACPSACSAETGNPTGA